jgi:phosphoribosyl-ATP pyrophosphohydrolase
MGYHIRTIKKGELGAFSKVEEEIEELLDANEQKVHGLIICEMADLIGAIEAYVEKRYNLTLDDLIKMKDLTKSAFEEGKRK